MSRQLQRITAERHGAMIPGAPLGGYTEDTSTIHTGTKYSIQAPHTVHVQYCTSYSNITIPEISDKPHPISPGSWQRQIAHYQSRVPTSNIQEGRAFFGILPSLANGRPQYINSSSPDTLNCPKGKKKRITPNPQESSASLSRARPPVCAAHVA